MNTPTITTETPTKFDTFVARTTEIDGRTFSASATEYNDPGQPVDRIMLNVHHAGYFSDNGKVHANVVSGQVNIDIGDLSVWIPVGREADVVAALEAGIVEQARQAEADEVCVVSITGDDPTGFRNTDAEVSA
jgi:hypothetical protein